MPTRAESWHCIEKTIVIASFRSRQFLIFLLSGGCAALVNFSSRILYNQWMSFSSAVILAYLTGMATAFVLFRILVFRQSSQRLHHSAIYFTLVNMLAIVQTWVISMLMANYFLPYMSITRHAQEIAHATGIVVPVFSSYLGHKHLSFK